MLRIGEDGEVLACVKDGFPRKFLYSNDSMFKAGLKSGFDLSAEIAGRVLERGKISERKLGHE